MANFENITIEKGMYQTRGGLTAALEKLDAPACDVQPGRKQYDYRGLRKLARLQPERAQRYPAIGSVDRSEAENAPKQDEYDDVEEHRQRPMLPPDAIVNPCSEGRHQQPRAKIHELALHEEIGIAMQTHCVRLARAGENDKAQRHENRDNQAESK